MTCKRLAVVVVYDGEGILDLYVRRLLRDIKKYVECLDVVVNGALTEESEKFLFECADIVSKRENKGYDFGAYKDELIRLGTGINNYDELILMNTTFFGFFYPLDGFFHEIRRRKDVDFWSFTKHSRGEWREGYPFDSHLQSYFLVICERMLQSRAFMEFWYCMDYAPDKVAAVYDGEIAFTDFFQKRGFRWEAFCKLENLGIDVEYNDNPYLKHPLSLIRDLRCPILKINSILVAGAYRESAFQAIAYLKEKNLYNVDWIWAYIFRSYRNGAMPAYVGLCGMDVFCSRFHKVYVYGIGRYGKFAVAFLAARGISPVGRLVTEKTADMPEDIREIKDLVRVQDDEGIILALNEDDARQVLSEVRKITDDSHIFMVKIGAR